jgi:AcrR family transcriptional regulator
MVADAPEAASDSSALSTDPDFAFEGQSRRARTLLAAAVQEFRELGMNSARFESICGRAKISRATGYRICPSGIEGILQLLHEDAMRRLVHSISSATARVGPPVAFREALESGVIGALDGLRSSPFIQVLCTQKPDLLRGYLLSDEPGGIVDVLGDYAARCAVNFGADDPAIVPRAKHFVRHLLLVLTSDIGPGCAPDLVWPDPEGDAAFARRVHEPLDEFTAVVIVNHAKRHRLAIPLVLLPPTAPFPDVAIGVR